MSKTIIYFIHQGYNERRNILYKKNINFIYKRDIDFFRILGFLYFKIFGKVNYTLNFLYFRPLVKNRNHHFFNSISLSKNSWITSFETSLPRLTGANTFIYKLAIKRIASSNCKKIIALSQCAYNIQDEYLKNNFPSYQEVIMNKCCVLHPPQKLLVSNVSEKQKLLNKKELVFTMVGGDFFRKGGKEILKVFKEIKLKDRHLNIVSSLNYGDYATNTIKEDKEAALKLIETNDNITLFNRLNNQEVIELFKKSHIGLLPTWADTYGYSILEAQACGCPVITTDIRACPEINNDECGWILKVPKDSFGNGKLNSYEERKEFSKILSQQLKNTILDILDKHNQIEKKFEKAIQRIQENHGLNKHAKLLNKIYIESFKG